MMMSAYSLLQEDSAPLSYVRFSKVKLHDTLKVNPGDGRQNGAMLPSMHLFEYYLGWSAVKEYNAVKNLVTQVTKIIK
jgi:hypothetical protein